MPLDDMDLGRLRDVIAYGERVQAMVAGLSAAAFVADPKTVYAVCYAIQVVGEAAWKVSESVKHAHTAIPWPLIAGMRHRLVHDYGRTDEHVVYQVATVYIPQLIEQVRAILAEESEL